MPLISHPQTAGLDWQKSSESQVLKVNVVDIDNMALTRILRRERPTMSVKDSLYTARLIKAVYTRGVTRGKVVNNA